MNQRTEEKSSKKYFVYGYGESNNRIESEMAQFSSEKLAQEECRRLATESIADFIQVNGGEESDYYDDPTTTDYCYIDSDNLLSALEQLAEDEVSYFKEILSESKDFIVGQDVIEEIHNSATGVKEIDPVTL